MLSKRKILNLLLPYKNDPTTCGYETNGKPEVKDAVISQQMVESVLLG